MKANTIETQEAPNKWWAARDANMRNIANASHFTDKAKVRAERMKQVMTLVYAAKGVYIAYGKRGFISVKVDGAMVKDNKNLALLEKDWEAEGVTKKVSAQGVIYRFEG